MKKYYFLSGLPRSGNTILSSILNQNPQISVSANSPVSEIMNNLEKSKTTDLAYRNFPDEKSYNNIIKNILTSYYEDKKENYIIDRSLWGTPDNLNLLKSYCPNEIKIIVLVRDVVEVIASFINWSNQNPKNFINENTNSGTIEQKCSYLMSPNGQIIKGLLNVYNLLQPENRDYAIFIDYNNFVVNPRREVERIYQFLNIPLFHHKFKDLNQFSNDNIFYDDACFGNGLHKLKTKKIEKSSYDVFKILPKHLIEEYSQYNITTI